MMANRWRSSLLGSTQIIKSLRKSNIRVSTISEYNDKILRDLRRTYPLNNWFNDHMESISNILNSYCYTNSGMGYSQGMAFIVFVLYKTFYEDNEEYATQDTFYAFHRVIQIIRPIYPIWNFDTRPIQFKDSVDSLIYMKLAIHDIDLAHTLKQKTEFIPLLIFQCLPALFANKFESIDDACILFDFIFCKKTLDMFHNVICVTCAVLIRFKAIFMYMKREQILHLIQVKEYYNVRKIICIANQIK